MAKTIVLDILRWEPTPGGLPRPVIRDDSESFTPEQVRDIRAWLEAAAPGYDPRKPSLTFIKLYRPEPGAAIASKVSYGHGNPEEKAAGVSVRTCTVGVHYEEGHVAAVHQYLCAVDDGVGLVGGRPVKPRFIVGPSLGVAMGTKPQAAVEVAAPIAARVVA